jgi:hypothetical protein
MDASNQTHHTDKIAVLEDHAMEFQRRASTTPLRESIKIYAT